MRKSASETFGRVYGVFKSLNLLNKEIMVELSGCSYKARCDESSFMVYRIHNNLGPRSHVPGWPVCLITQDTIFEECHSSDNSSNDSFHCGTSLEAWMEIIAGSCDRTEQNLDSEAIYEITQV